MALRREDNILRDAVCQNLDKWLKKLACSGNVEEKLAYKMKFVEKLRSSPIAIETEKANAQHYKVPTDFFRTVLGERLKYSCCLWSEGATNLEGAEDAMLKLICQRAKIQDGHSIMDLGSGWGSLALWLCEQYPRCTVTTVSNSRTQQQWIRSEAHRKGFMDRITCITSDANVFNTQLTFDRVVSIEMFEHMKNYEELMHRVASWLKQSGYLFVQILCHREFAYSFNTSSNSDTEWMARNFFSGGTMPSSDLLLYFQKDLCVEKHWQINGKNYSRTLEAWLARMDRQESEVRGIFQKTYTSDQVDQQVFNWRMFFIYCAEVFAFRGGNEWIVAQYLFEKKLISNL
ncbi:(S)-coclaurine N-methyltransferase-like [Acropora millepora]|uniref:(S)-coclaurine N-methyltransferase-like n=1 Tax=Acropora millepora TaxID=45264 RepID=UPI001CF5654C|nr:(S)-coclaurine N-methyltransferase-like [Acropora millepora]